MCYGFPQSTTEILAAVLVSSHQPENHVVRQHLVTVP
jgi:hypothetical protein